MAMYPGSPFTPYSPELYAPRPDASQLSNILRQLYQMPKDLVYGAVPYVQSAYNFVATPENQLAPTAPPQLPPPPLDFAQGGPGNSAVVNAETPLYSLTQNSLPAPPQMPVFQQGMPPAPAPLPQPSMVPPTDYSATDLFLEQAAPQRSSTDFRKLGWKQGFAGAAQGFANWDPRTDWGGLIAGAAAPFAAGMLNARQQEMQANDEFTNAMRDFALRRAEIDSRRAETAVSREDTNRRREQEFKVQTSQQQRDFELEKFRIQSQNLANIHEANVTNTKLLYEKDIKEWEMKQSKVLDASKDGVLLQTYENGKQTVKYTKFTGKETSDLKVIKENYGEESSTYKLAVYHDLVESGNTLGLMRQVAINAVKGGYAAELVGQDQFDQMKKEAEGSITAELGSKEYAEQFQSILANKLIKGVKINDPQQLQILELNGDPAGTYLKGYVQNGNQGR